MGYSCMSARSPSHSRCSIGPPVVRFLTNGPNRSPRPYMVSPIRRDISLTMYPHCSSLKPLRGGHMLIHGSGIMLSGQIRHLGHLCCCEMIGYVGDGLALFLNVAEDLRRSRSCGVFESEFIGIRSGVDL